MLYAARGQSFTSSNQPQKMNIKTFRAKSMQQALDLVRKEFGSDASVLHTRELNTSGLSRLVRGRQIEVVATPDNPVRDSSTNSKVDVAPEPALPAIAPPAYEHVDYRAKYRQDLGQELTSQLGSLHSMVEELCASRTETVANEMPRRIFEAYTDLIEADVDEATARELIDTLQASHRSIEQESASEISAQLTRLVESQFTTVGPIQVHEGVRRLVALVGPTGVGKTTTIAKLAANFRLREKKRVGLITVDTYRVAAVEQLRTYADIIDLPMEVVSTPREMREAVARMTDLDLVLIDTAGRSPRDEVQIQELKSMLGEAQADEVHLVLSSTSSAKSLSVTADRFQQVGATSLLLTKLDETMSLGHLLTLTRSCRLPISYLTNGQSVPDDIAVAESKSLASMLMGETAVL